MFQDVHYGLHTTLQLLVDESGPSNQVLEALGLRSRAQWDNQTREELVSLIVRHPGLLALTSALLLDRPRQDAADQALSVSRRFTSPNVHSLTMLTLIFRREDLTQAADAIPILQAMLVHAKATLPNVHRENWLDDPASMYAIHLESS